MGLCRRVLPGLRRAMRPWGWRDPSGLARGGPTARASKQSGPRVAPVAGSYWKADAAQCVGNPAGATRSASRRPLRIRIRGVPRAGRRRGSVPTAGRWMRSTASTSTPTLLSGCTWGRRPSGPRCSQTARARRRGRWRGRCKPIPCSGRRCLPSSGLPGPGTDASSAGERDNGNRARRDEDGSVASTSDTVRVVPRLRRRGRLQRLAVP